MSSELLHTLKDENPNLHKQIGCMNGFFQIFYGHHILPCRRVKGQKKIPPIPGQSGNHGVQPKGALQKASGRSAKRAVKEKLRASTESSRTSFSSSSCSSSFSSLECNRITQLEPSFYGQSKLSENPSRGLPSREPTASVQSKSQHINFQDVVKDSIHREASALSVKTATKEEAQNHIFKHVDSPRPLQLQTPAKQRNSGISESFQSATMIRQASLNSKEEKDGSRLLTRDAPRDGSRLLTRDAPRFSFDGRESRDTFKSLKIKELPRLSLDSRQSTMRAAIREMKPNNDLHVENKNSNTTPNPQQEQGSYKRQSRVVAKLMGLEAFPGDTSSNDYEGQTGLIGRFPGKEVETISRSARSLDESKPNYMSGSPKNSHQNSISPQMRNADSVAKTNPSSKFPIEPAPWRRGSQVAGLKHQEANTKASNLSGFVYGEIGKRLADIEFKKSGKDLRALKRILEAMQKTAEMSETRKDNQGTNLASQAGSNGSLDGSPKLPIQGNLQSSNSAIIKGNSSPRSSRSINMILKPATPVGRANDTSLLITSTDSVSSDHKFQTGTDNRKGSVDKRPTKDPIQRGNPSNLHSANVNARAQTSRSMQTAKVAIHITGENNTSSCKNSGAMSPRLHKKNGHENQSCTPTTSSDSNRTRRQLSRQVTEPGSPRTKQKPRSPSSPQRNNQLKEASSNIKDLRNHRNAINTLSESSTCSASHIETEITRTNSSDRTNRTFLEPYGQKQKSLEFKLKANRAVAEPAGVTLEQPSPISVLNATFYRDESPSPVMKVTNTVKDDEAVNSDEAQWTSAALNQHLQTSTSNLSSENGHDKSENIKYVVSRIRHDESIDYITVLPEDSNPEHRYIYKILLASGLLRDLDSAMAATPLYSSANPINHKVFLAVEQSMASIGLTNDEHFTRNISHKKSVEEIQRKLIFDAVNETLQQKLVPEGCSKQWFSPKKLAGRRLKGQELLKDLCEEIDQLQANKSSCSSDNVDDNLTSVLWEDLMHQSTEWSDHPSEISGLVLDIESLIFKDLITEAVNGETAGLQACSGGYRRKLFY